MALRGSKLGEDQVGCHSGHTDKLTVEWQVMVHAGRRTQAESGGNPEKGGCCSGWEGFLEGVLLLHLKEDREKVEGNAMQCKVIAADISQALSLCQALVQVVGIYEAI